MVLQVAPDAAQFVPRLNADTAQVFSVADTGKLQDVRRADGTGREYYLAGRIDAFQLTIARVLDTNRARTVEQHAPHQCASDHLQVRPFRRRMQIAARGACTSSPTARVLYPADAVTRTWRQIIDVCAKLAAELLAGLNCRLA